MSNAEFEMTNEIDRMSAMLKEREKEFNLILNACNGMLVGESVSLLLLVAGYQINQMCEKTGTQPPPEMWQVAIREFVRGVVRKGPSHLETLVMSALIAFRREVHQVGAEAN